MTYALSIKGADDERLKIHIILVVLAIEIGVGLLIISRGLGLALLALGGGILHILIRVLLLLCSLNQLLDGSLLASLLGLLRVAGSAVGLII